MVKHIEDGKHNLLGIIVYSNFTKEGIHFFTTNNLSQQLAYMKRPRGYVIDAHRHNIVYREVLNTLETIFVKSGKVEVDFFTSDNIYVCSEIIQQGDVLLLISGGHGFTMLEESELIEVKQGPYADDRDKVRFRGVK